MNTRRTHRIVGCLRCALKEAQLRTLRRQIALKDQDVAELRRQLAQSTLRYVQLSGSPTTFPPVMPPAGVTTP